MPPEPPGSPPLRVALVTVGDPGTLTGGYLYHARLAELAPRHGAAVEFVSFPDRTFPLARLAAGRVARELRSLGPDAVLLDSLAAAFFPLDRESAGAPVVAILHQPPGGIDHGPLRTAVQAALDRAAYRRADRLLVASTHLAETVAAQGFPRERMRVAAPGRDVAASSGSTARSWRPVDLRRGRSAAFLCVGNWVERKGILQLLDAVAALPEGAATLHLAGDEDAEPRYGDRVRARLSRADVAGRVVRHGKLARSAVAALYAAADAFVLASTREPYGTVYGEAMAAGLPVVGWRAGNLPHLATDGVDGLIVEPGDVEGLAAALGRLAGDEGLRRRLGAAAGRRAEGLPTWDDTARLVVSSIREVVAG